MISTLSPSLLDPIVGHPAVAALCVDVRPRSRLKARHGYLFNNTNTKTNTTNDNKNTWLFNELALVACGTGVVCRKELLETYAAATLMHAKFPHAKRMADLAAGHGLLAWCLLALDDLYDDDDHPLRRRQRTVVCVDRRIPPSADVVAAAMVRRFPALAGRWCYVQADLVAVVPHPSCVLVSVHACGTLTDLLLDLALAGRRGAPLAVVPCCHTVKASHYRPHRRSKTTADEVRAAVATRKRGVTGEARHAAVADVVDDVRRRTLLHAGFAVEEVRLPAAFTGRNRLLLAEPPSGGVLSDTASGSTPSDFFQRRSPPPLEGGSTTKDDDDATPMTTTTTLHIPLADNPESIAHCHAISGRDRAETRLRERIPQHFSPTLVLSLWLPTIGTTTPSSVPLVTAATLQTLADRYLHTEQQDANNVNNYANTMITCTVATFGEVHVQSGTGRRSQRYGFKYQQQQHQQPTSPSEVSWNHTTTQRHHKNGIVSRTTAKKLHAMLRKRIVDTFGDVLR